MPLLRKARLGAFAQREEPHLPQVQPHRVGSDWAPGPAERKEGTAMLRKWVAEHHRIVCVFLLALAVLNAWVSYMLFSQHPIMALANGTMALILILGVIFTW